MTSMERLPEQTTRALGDGMAPIERRLPSGANKVERIAQHTKGLAEDVTSWVELRLKLAQIEIEERIDAKVNDLAGKAVVAGLAALGALFALVTLALGAAALGVAIGLSQTLSLFLGFLLVTILLFVAALVFRSAKPRMIPITSGTVAVEEDRLSGTAPEPGE
jgi:uncharacterized membrane protein YqjE